MIEAVIIGKSFFCQFWYSSDGVICCLFDLFIDKMSAINHPHAHAPVKDIKFVIASFGLSLYSPLVALNISAPISSIGITDSMT